MQQLESSSLTHPGRKRQNNEDCYLSQPERGLWAVADGMGGHEAGEVASEIVRRTLAGAEDQPLKTRIEHAHRAVLEAAANGEGAQGMGSTVVAVQAGRAGYEVAWVGDSRAYRYRDGKLEQLTTDHSYVQMLVQTGAIEAGEAENHPDKNIITQCLGSDELSDVKVDTRQEHWRPGERLLLCSDGLTDELCDADIAGLLERHPGAARAADALMQTALQAGGQDNITLQVIEAPLTGQKLKHHVGEWVPIFTRNRRLDAAIYLTALGALVGLLYWIVY